MLHDGGEPMRIRFFGTGASEGAPAMFCDCPAREAACQC